MITNNIQRQQLLCAYLLGTDGMIPSVFQTVLHKGKTQVCEVRFTRHYFLQLAKGEAPHLPIDLTGIDQILTDWDREVVR